MLYCEENESYPYVTVALQRKPRLNRTHTVIFKPKVMENAVRSPSLHMGRGPAQQHLSPPHVKAVSLGAHVWDFEEVSIPLERGWPERAPS